MTHPPQLFVSPCLGVFPCRYDGSILDLHWTERLYELVEVIGVCPEQEAGFSTPRPAMKFIQKAENFQLQTKSSDQDLTITLANAAERIAQKLPNLDGAIVKSKSPSCAIDDCKVFKSQKAIDSIDLREGIFTGALKRKFPQLPIIDEQEIEKPEKRLLFFMQALQSCQIKQLDSWDKVKAFHQTQRAFLQFFDTDGLTHLNQAFAQEELTEYKKSFKDLLQNVQDYSDGPSQKDLIKATEGLARLEQAFTRN